MEWTYTIEEVNFGKQISEIEAQLNELGGGGWEAVSALPVAGMSKEIFYILFKKPK